LRLEIRETRNFGETAIELSTTLTSGHVARLSIYDVSDYDLKIFKSDKKSARPRTEINWSALGSVCADDAEAYSELIAEAVKIARDLDALIPSRLELID
jgi:hypothetical protein